MWRWWTCACRLPSPTRGSGRRSRPGGSFPACRCWCCPSTSSRCTPGSCSPQARAGLGYLLKDRVSDVLRFIEAIRTVAAGGTAMDPEVVSQLLARHQRDDRLGRLTAREREVLGLMAEGTATPASHRGWWSPRRRSASTSAASSPSSTCTRPRMPTAASSRYSPTSTPDPGRRRVAAAGQAGGRDEGICGSVAGALAAVDVQDLAGDERGALQVERPPRRRRSISPIRPTGCRAREELVGLLGVHRGLDDARRDGVDADAAGGVLDRQRLGGRLQAALGQRGQRRGNLGVGVVDQAGGDVARCGRRRWASICAMAQLGDAEEAAPGSRRSSARSRPAV